MSGGPFIAIREMSCSRSSPPLQYNVLKNRVGLQVKGLRRGVRTKYYLHNMAKKCRQSIMLLLCDDGCHDDTYGHTHNHYYLGIVVNALW